MEGDFYPDRVTSRLKKEGSVLVGHPNWPGCLLRPARLLLRSSFRALPVKYARDESVERKVCVHL